MSDWKARAEVFEHSYEEVLAALKHQDEKLNRTLTAIAFLTAAGVTLYTTVGKNVSLTYDGMSANVPTFFFVLFLVLVVLALVSALAAIGPSTPLRDKSDYQGKSGSLIYYEFIRRDEEWPKYIDWAPAQLYEKLAKNFHNESLTIARRVRYKVARSRESGSFVQLVIISLSLLGIFSVESFSASTRWWIASSF